MMPATCAVQTGCFPGDAPGYPVQITQPGSHRLTSNLVLPNLATTGISITADDVSIDLNGFGIRGPNTCDPGSCNGVGSGNGITKESILDNRKRISVTNGIVSGTGGACILLGDEARVESVSVSGCGGAGIVVGARSTVFRNRIVSIRQRGLNLGGDSAFADNVIALAGLGGVPGQTETVVGGTSTGGNVCDDGRCTSSQRRRFYLTTTAVTGPQAPAQCASGFHFASLWEIFQTASLSYATTEGLTRPDSGAGPPTGVYGWIRTGWFSDSTGTGEANCDVWTSSGYGSAVSLDNGWLVANPTPSIQPWLGAKLLCAESNFVWCVEN